MRRDQAGKIAPNAVDDFWSRVEKTDGCWLWRGVIIKRTGYGQFCFDWRRYSAHRFSWISTHGPITGGLWVLHHCDNRPCVRPEHLYLGTAADNMADRSRRGRAPCGEKNGQAKLTEESVRRIRELRAGGQHQVLEIAAILNVSLGAVEGVIYGRTWREVTDAPA